MEEKIKKLIAMTKEYNQTSEEYIDMTLEKGVPTVYVMGDCYRGATFEKAIDKAIKAVLEMIQEVEFGSSEEKENYKQTERDYWAVQGVRV